MRFILLVVILLICGLVQANQTEEWRRSVDGIINDVLAIHPAPFQKTAELIWRRKAQALKNELPALSEEKRLVRLMQLIALIGDGHTRIELINYKYGLWYPFRIYEFNDGYFVTSVHKSHQDLVGMEVISIAGYPVGEVLKNARSLMGADNQFDAKERLYAVHNAFLMKGLGYANEDNSLKITFRSSNGSQITKTLQATRMAKGFYPDGVPIFDWTYRHEVFGTPIGKNEDTSRKEWIAAYGNTTSSDFLVQGNGRPVYFQHMSRYTRRAIPEKDAYYIQFNQTDDFGMVGYLKEAFTEIEQQKPKRLIIDIRNNFGGDGSTVVRMIHQFIQRKKEKLWQELYLITGRKTFSAAVAVIDAFVDNTNITLVGEPAGAGLNSYGDAVSRKYPAIGVNFSVSTLRHQLGQSNDLRPFIPVGVPTPLSFDDYIVGRDVAVDPILEGMEMRSIEIIALDLGGTKARKIYNQRKNANSDLDWYRSPEEIALRYVAMELTEQGRHEDAIETARLNTEIHPYIWNTWYNLAGALSAAGSPHRQTRYSSYKCVLLLEPSNWNAVAIQSLFERDKVNPVPEYGCPIKK